MDLTDAINAHTDWKITLRAAISDRENVDAGVIARDDHCEFGRWLQGTAREGFGWLPAHQECVVAHARFHLCAGEVAEAISAREYSKAEQLLARGTRYALASRAIVLSIEALRWQIDERGPRVDRADA